jgi:hypothetical protein
MLKKWRLSPIFQMGCRPKAFAILALPKRCRPLFPDFASLPDHELHRQQNQAVAVGC